jgi:catechol 2,3-dioxygenase-like lactoylglutathione lyase family enzyme
MELKSISGFTCYVKDIKKTAAFYKALGFRFGAEDDEMLVAYVNWFSIKFLAIGAEDNAEFQKQANATSKGDGIYINIKVDNVDEFYAGMVAKGLKPSSEPRDWPWGNREFAMRDPDGYKLVFFEKK